MSVFAPLRRGVFRAFAGDPRAVPMAVAGAAVLVAGLHVAVLAAEVLGWTRARVALARE